MMMMMMMMMATCKIHLSLRNCTPHSKPKPLRSALAKILDVLLLRLFKSLVVVRFRTTLTANLGLAG